MDFQWLIQGASVWVCVRVCLSAGRSNRYSTPREERDLVHEYSKENLPRQWRLQRLKTIRTAGLQDQGRCTAGVNEPDCPQLCTNLGRYIQYTAYNTFNCILSLWMPQFGAYRSCVIVTFTLCSRCALRKEELHFHLRDVSVPKKGLSCGKVFS